MSSAAGAWEHVREAIAGADAHEVARRVLALDEAGRRAVARELPGHIAPAREAQHRRAQERHTWDWSVSQRWIAPMRVAGAGTFGGAAAVATWLYRRELGPWTSGADLAVLVRVLKARPPEWQADLAARLALRLRGTRAQRADDSVELALAMLRHTKIVPPDHEPLVVAWVSAPPRLPKDPLAGHLLPRLFEAEGVGCALRDDRPDWSPEQSWLRRLSDLARSGELDRDLLVDGCVRRFLRGGTGPDLRFFVRLHDLLDPAPDPARTHDYLRLLPAAPGPVAELAVKQVRGALSGEELTEAVGALLFRPEAKLVRAGLSLLEQAAKAAEGDLDHLAPALASAFLCTAHDVRERTVRLAVRYAGRFTPAGAEAVREAAAVLPADLLAGLTEAYGRVEAAAEDFRAVPLPAFEAPRRERLDGGSVPEDHGLRFELWLDALVRDPAAGRKLPKDVPALRWFGGDVYALRCWPDLAQWADALRRAAVGGAAPGDPRSRVSPHDLVPAPHQVAVPHRVTLLRCAEVLDALKHGTPPPYLLATPTCTSGQIDPAELVARLEGYAAKNVPAMPADLQQALLRLPREVPAEVADRAWRLTSAAGASLVHWLAARPEANPRVEWRNHAPYASFQVEATGLELVDELLGALQALTHMDAMNHWRLVLPSDREVVAMYLIPHLANRWGWPAALPDLLRALLHQDGPPGTAMAALIGVLAAERGWIMPDGAGERLLLEAVAAGALPAAECGRQLAFAVRGDLAKMSEVLLTLESCARQGAHREVWEIMAGMLPAFLPGPGERSTQSHTRALAFAAEAARWAGARETLPVVAEIAGRAKVNGFVRAARLLHEQLHRGT
ncbi:DUF6493 family protein [Nonomuraea typhae]|uniref:DUF7824 domain-containing protein n=1 Tax=Nonomuraea typhae TaxID=2603600 RepID=UPI0012F937EA|nr:DUF6493 family protein [Nonomuraea typhae]